jgi:hypothetical protein
MAVGTALDTALSVAPELKVVDPVEADDGPGGLGSAVGVFGLRSKDGMPIGKSRISDSSSNERHDDGVLILSSSEVAVGHERGRRVRRRLAALCHAKGAGRVRIRERLFIVETVSRDGLVVEVLLFPIVVDTISND